MMLVNVGELHECSINFVTAACARFGAEKAEIIISSAEFAISQYWDVVQYTRGETGYSLTPDDMAFITIFIQAKSLIKQAIKTLKGDIYAKR